MSETFSWVYTNRVRFAETDAQGIVYFGEFVKYLDEATFEFYRRIGHPYEERIEEGEEMVIAHVEVDYHQPARFPDEIRHGVAVSELGESSITFDYRAEGRDEGQLLAEGSVVQVAIDDNGEATPISDSLRSSIREFQLNSSNP